MTALKEPIQNQIKILTDIMPHLKLDLLLPSLGVTQFHRQRAIVDQLVFG